jgi:hypothetical protein
LSQATTSPDTEHKLEMLREAARRANWDAQQGPRHLRSGRFFVSRTQDADASTAQTQVGGDSSPPERE